jgi:hypothetical protein
LYYFRFTSGFSSSMPPREVCGVFATVRADMTSARNNIDQLRGLSDDGKQIR